MQDDAFVVIFPAEFSRFKILQLIANIKRILKAKDQNFEFVKRDGNVIVVRANDPVLASSTINQLFGIEKTAIARRTEPDMDSVVSETAKLGGNLLLRDEKFLVRVEGEARGFVPKDAEIAITSSIIDKKASQEATPGSENKHDRLLYTYITKKSAYVCIFLDRGHGGVPNLSQKQETVCPVYDEISAISCIESMKQGFDVKIVVPYKKRSELSRIAKILNRIIRFVLSSKIELEFYNLYSDQISNPLDLQSSMVRLCCIIAKEYEIPRISVPITNQIFPIEFVDSVSRFLSESQLLPHFPLEGKEDAIRDMARRYVLEKFVTEIRIRKNSTFAEISEKRFGKIASNTLKTRRVISVEPGPNNLHDILDSLE